MKIHCIHGLSYDLNIYVITGKIHTIIKGDANLRKKKSLENISYII